MIPRHLFTSMQASHVTHNNCFQFCRISTEITLYPSCHPRAALVCFGDWWVGRTTCNESMIQLALDIFKSNCRVCSLLYRAFDVGGWVVFVLFGSVLMHVIFGSIKYVKLDTHAARRLHYIVCRNTLCVFLIFVLKHWGCNFQVWLSNID